MRVLARMNIGGPAVQANALMEDLDQTRFESRLLVGLTEADEAEFFDFHAPTYPVTRIRTLGRSARPFDDGRALARLAVEMRRFRPHIVHTHTAKAGILGRVAAKASGVPVVVHTFHGHLLHGYFSPRVTGWVVRTERALARISDGLIAVGARVRDDLLQAGVGRPNQFFIVPPGVDLPQPPPRSTGRERLQLPKDGRVVLFVGRLTQIKRPERFVEIALRLAGQFPDVVFVVAGGGDLLESIQAQSRPLGDRIRFLGWSGKMPDAYAAADLVVLTSDNEGTPVSLIEAAFAGLAVVATDVGSTREVVVDGVTGLLSDQSVPNLASNVAQLLADDARRMRMGKAAAEHAQQRFGRARLVSDVADIYMKLAASRGIL